MATIEDLRALGYQVSVAHGGVAVEAEALAAAQAAADPATVITQVNTLTSDTLQTLANIGKLPDTPEGKLELSAQIGAAALDMLTEHIDATVAFHQRALEIAQSMPTVYGISGPGFGVYVSVDDATGLGSDEGAQAILDSLADPTAHAERCFQVDNPDAMRAAGELASKGYAIERPVGADSFTVDEQTMDAAAIVAFNETAEPKPPAPTATDRVTDVLMNAPELSDATKQALQAALTPPDDVSSVSAGG